MAGTDVKWHCMKMISPYYPDTVKIVIKTIVFFLLFSRFRFADLAKINSQQADGFLRNNGLKYTPVCIHTHANSMIVL